MFSVPPLHQSALLTHCVHSGCNGFFPPPLSPRMLKYITVQSGIGLLAVRRACVLSRFAHSTPQTVYRPIKKVMVANRGKRPIGRPAALIHQPCRAQQEVEEAAEL